MKRIKIAAIGAMLLLGIACSKDKNQVQPTYNNSSNTTPSQPYKGGSTIKSEENINNNGLTRQAYGDPVVTPNPPILTTDPNNTDPARIRSGNLVEPPPRTTARIIRGVRNDEVINPYQNANKTATTIVLPKKAIDDLDTSPNQNPY